MTLLATAPRTRQVLSRANLFAALLLLTVANAVASRTALSFQDSGLVDAVVNGLGISWAFWLALFLAMRLAVGAPDGPASRIDLVVGVVILVLVAAPFRQLSAMAATGLGLWFVVGRGVSPRLRAAAIILVALSATLLWTHVLLLFLARPLEFIDARMVGFFAGTTTNGNIVNFVGQDHGYVIMTGCTSVQNASMALLLWLAIARSARNAPRPSDLLVGLGVFLSVVAINILRLCLMAQGAAAFARVHGDPGAGLVNLAITLAGLAWALWDVRRELFARS